MRSKVSTALKFLLIVFAALFFIALLASVHTALFTVLSDAPVEILITVYIFLSTVILACASLWILKSQMAQLEDEHHYRHRNDLNERTSTAITHLAEQNPVIQCAGLVELANLVDEWWFFHEREIKENTRVIYNQKKYKHLGIAPKEESKRECKNRCQELCDIIFTSRFPQTPDFHTDSPEREIDYAWTAIQRTRSHLVVNNFGRKNSWKDLSLANADLRDTVLTNANFAGVNLEAAHLTGARLKNVYYDAETIFPDGKNYCDTHFDTNEMIRSDTEVVHAT